MKLQLLDRVNYGVLGVLYLLVGSGSLLLPAGWLPPGLVDRFLAGERLSDFMQHQLQEFGTVVIAVGLVFLWHAGRMQPIRSLHWAMTFYLALDALIHWVGPQGPIGDWQRGIINSIPLAVMLLLGVALQRKPHAGS
jgi:hypothetical protein